MIYVHLAKGFEEIEALTCVDLLRRAGLPVETVSCDPARTVTGSHGISVEADTLFVSADYDGAEMIVLPGGMPGTTNLRAHEKLCQKIREFAAAEDKKVAAICAAPMILGQLGLLEGKKATIYPGMEEELKGAIVAGEDEKVVTDGNIMTSKGPGTAMDFALAIIKWVAGDEKYEEVKNGLIYR